MNVREYNKVFGVEPYQVDPSEVIIDIGSGDSDLSDLTPNGLLIQVDPAYTGSSQDQLTIPNESSIRLAVTVGSNDETTRSALKVIGELEPSRVTMANALRYVPSEDKVRAIEQMLLLGRYGLTQLYPFRQKNADAVIERAERLGFTVTGQKVGLGGLRQAAYALTKINTTITVESQPKRAGPADRKKLAELIVSRVI